MNDRDFITSIRDQCNAHLGGGSGTPPAPGAVAPVTVKPSAFADLGVGSMGDVQKNVAAGEIVGLTFTVDPNKKNERKIKWEGHPGQFWTHNSWAIFDSGGQRVFYADNAVVSGTLGAFIEGELMQLGGGTYTVGIATNGNGRLAFFWIQN